MTSFFASGGSQSGKFIGVGALVVVAIGGLVYSFSSYGGGDTIAPVTETADGHATMRKLTCGKCGYEEEVTSAVFNERMRERADPNQWLECPKCHENAVQRANSGKPLGSPAPVDIPVPPEAYEQPPPDESVPVVPKVHSRNMSPGA